MKAMLRVVWSIGVPRPISHYTLSHSAAEILSLARSRWTAAVAPTTAVCSATLIARHIR